MEHYLIIGASFFLLSTVVAFLPLRRTSGSVYLLSFSGTVVFGLSGLKMGFSTPHGYFVFSISSFFTFSFSGDALSGFFIFLVSALSMTVCLYSIGYTGKIKDHRLMAVFFNLFILSMYGVLLSGNIITFIVMWEGMTVISYFLVTFERDREAERAGLVYAVMTHIGAASIIALLLILYKYTGSMEFNGMREGAPFMPEGVRSMVFILALAGFGAKAGIVPLHTWLPRAHPAAPSNISALMSGVMIKTGIYGIIRIGMDVLGTGPVWWGLTILIVGAISSVLGVLYALMEHDLKRLLAYHSVENIGIILLGIGMAMVFKSNSMHLLSAMAVTAGLYHTLNHALFKGLLFLGAGSVLHATHTKDMEKMGGLLKRMPYTGAFFLIGSLSICAFPPFNGFISEWLTYQAMLTGFDIPLVTAKVISPLGATALALTGALAGACFVKAFGISFLGVPRSEHAMNARESSLSMLVPMGLLAGLCLLFGVMPAAVAYIIGPASFMLTGVSRPAITGGVLSILKTPATVSPSGLLLMLLTMAGATFIFIRITGGRRKTVCGESWNCGIPALSPRMQYTAMAFTKPIKLIFRRLYLPRREIRVDYILSPLFVRAISYHGDITHFFEGYIYKPFTNLLHQFAKKARLIQSGSLRLYLGYILMTLIVLLIFWS